MFDKDLLRQLDSLPTLLSPIIELVNNGSDLNNDAIIDALSCNRATIGKLCLLSFTQDNWYGPETSFWTDESRVLFQNHISFLHKLELNTQTVYALCVKPVILYIGKVLLLDNLPGNPSLEDLIWAVRCIKVWQGVLDEPVVSLSEKLTEILSKFEVAMQTLEEKSRLVSVFSELSLLSFTFYKNREGKRFMDRMVESSGLDVQFAGAMGVATKFQKEERSQLYVKVTESDFKSTCSEVNQSSYPTNKALDDDTLLPETKFTDPSLIEMPDICLEQQVALALKLYMLSAHFAHDASNEVERKAVISALNRLPSKYYHIQFLALYQRCILEGSHVRYLDRLLMQMEHLSECYERSAVQEGKNAAFFALPIPAKWEVRRKYGEILADLGCTATALEVFTKLELWEQAAVCLVKLDRRQEGAELIRKQLEVMSPPPSAKMWCLLGDVTGDIDHYHTALKLSGNRHARAFKALGIHYVQKKDYKEAIGNFEKSLECNSLQPGVWYTLACCAMGVRDWAVAMRACQTYVKLEPENAEAWCNLGVVFLNLNEKVRAYRAFSEAVRHSFHNWKIWENLLFTSIDIHAYSDSIRAMRHIVSNSPEKKVDLDALKILCSAVITEKPDFNTSVTPDKNKSSLIELMGFLTSKISTNPFIWEYYGDVYFFTADDFAGKEKGVRNYFRAVRQLLNTPGLESKHTVYAGAITRVSKIVRCFNEFVNCERVNVQTDMASEFLGINRNIENFLGLSKLFPEELDEKSRKSLEEVESSLRQLQSGLAKCPELAFPL